MTDTLRRPAIPGVPLDPRFTSQTLIELPFPAKLDTIDALITAYLDEVRKPASAIFVLDVSGSMEGDRLDELKTAMKALTGHGHEPHRQVRALPRPRAGDDHHVLHRGRGRRASSRSTTRIPTART